MLRSLYTAATGMEAQQLRLDVISNNLANTSTTGFKKVRADFEDLLSETVKGAQAPDPRGGANPTPLQVGLGVRTGSTTRDFSQGDLQNTGNALDLAIQGSGFFRVQRTDGTYGYTRAGNLRSDSTGRLVDMNGNSLDPEITLPTDTAQVTINADGAVLTTNSAGAQTQVGQISLYTFPNPGGLEAVGTNLLVQTAASGEPTTGVPGSSGTGSLAQGFLEGANVKAVDEMVDMIATQRAYELNTNVIKTADQMLQKITNLR
jgi:flagellar basal-body rod protein FlgG